MSVFRLDPFSIHHNSERGVSDPLMNVEQAGPLTEESRYINYQLNDTENNERQSDGELPLREIQVLENDKGADSRWAGSNDAGHVARCQSPDWSLDGPHRLSPHASSCLEVAYADAISMWISCTLILLIFILTSY